MKKQLRGSLVLLVTAIIWGVAFVGQNEGMKYLGPFSFNAIRMIFAALAMIPTAFISLKISGSCDAVRGKNLRRTVTGGIICGTFLFCASTAQQLGIKITESSGKAGFITSLYIIIVPLIGLLLRRRPHPVLWPCVAVATAGFWLICGGTDSHVGTGELLLLACALFFSLQITAIDLLLRPGIDPVCMSTVQFITCAGLMTVAMFVTEKPTSEGIVAALPWMLYVGLLSGALGYTLQMIGQKDCPPTAASLIMSLESVVAALSGWAISGERLGRAELIGCGLVFTAVVVSQIPFGSLKKKNAPGQTGGQ